MIAEIHVSPSPSGTEANRYQHVEAAIGVVQKSGLAYEVTALGTTFEGDADVVWATLRAAHEAGLGSGADGVITSIRIGDRSAEPTTMQALTAKFRT
ncbi:MAG: MTH1187 family thiamine-binding protein [Acidimicrobiales bacterium]